MDSKKDYSETNFTTPPSSRKKEESPKEDPPQENAEKSTRGEEKEKPKVEITKEDEDKYLETMATFEPYRERYDMPGGISVGFKTREYAEVQESYIRLDRLNIQIYATWFMAKQKFFLASALDFISVNGKVQPFSGTFDDRVKKIEKMQSHIFLHITDKMAIFDEKVMQIKKKLDNHNSSKTHTSTF